MSYAVGVDLGTTQTTVAIARWDNAFPSRRRQARVVAKMPSVGYLGEDGTLIVGLEAHERGCVSPHRVIRDFKRRIGDDVPIVVEGWREQPEYVFAAIVRVAVTRVVEREGMAPEVVVVTYPTGWGVFKQTLLMAALKSAGLRDVLLVSEAAAAVAQVVPQASFAAKTIAVYDLGGSSFGAAVLANSSDAGSSGQHDPDLHHTDLHRPDQHLPDQHLPDQHLPDQHLPDDSHPDGCYEVLGIPQQVDWLGGADFDQAVYSLVQDGANLPRLSTADQAVVAAMGQIRRDCVDAKIALSLDTETTIPVVLPQLSSRVRLVRSEFEELIRDSIEETLEVLRAVISSAGLTSDDLDGIVLAGGSSGIPLVAQMISAEFSRPLIVDVHPDASIALGAAELAVRAVNPAAAVPTPARAPVTAGSSPAVISSISGPASVATGSVPSAQLPGATSGRESRNIARGEKGGPPPNEESSGQLLLSAPAPDRALEVAAARDAVPAEQREEAAESRGRHRHRPGRRYWLRGLVASIAAVVVAGSSLAASKAAESDAPAEQATETAADSAGRVTSQAPIDRGPGGPDATQEFVADPSGTVADAGQTTKSETPEHSIDPVVFVKAGMSGPGVESPATPLVTVPVTATVTTTATTTASTTPPVNGSEGSTPDGTGGGSPAPDTQLDPGLAAPAAADFMAQDVLTTLPPEPEPAGGTPPPVTVTEPTDPTTNLPPVEATPTVAATVETPAVTDTAVDRTSSTDQSGESSDATG